jgi:hypothetical protein
MDQAPLVVELIFVLGLIFVLCRRPQTTFAPHSWSRLPTAAEWIDAQERADALLRDLLSEAEYAQLTQRGYLEVPSPERPGRVYRIPRRHGQVRVIDNGVPSMSLCVQPVDPVPDGDVVIMHKLMIEGNEREYLSIANRFEPTLYGFMALRPRNRV